MTILSLKEIKDLTDKIGTKQDWTLSPHSLRLWSLRVQDALDLLGKTPPPRQMVTILRATLPRSTGDRLRALGEQGPQDTTALFEYLDVQVEGMKNSDMDRHEARIASAEQGHRSHADWVSYLEQLRAIDMSMGIRRMPDFWSRILLNRLAVRSDIQLGLNLTRGNLTNFDFVRDQVLRLDCGLTSRQQAGKRSKAHFLEEPADVDYTDEMEDNEDYDQESDEGNDDDNDDNNEEDPAEANFANKGKPKGKASLKKGRPFRKPAVKGFRKNKQGLFTKRVGAVDKDKQLKSDMMYI